MLSVYGMKKVRLLTASLKDSNKRQKDYLWKQRTHYGLENRVSVLEDTLRKQTYSNVLKILPPKSEMFR